jgi:hypothetical protein
LKVDDGQIFGKKAAFKVGGTSLKKKKACGEPAKTEEPSSNPWGAME